MFSFINCLSINHNSHLSQFRVKWMLIIYNRVEISLNYPRKEFFVNKNAIKLYVVCSLADLGEGLRGSASPLPYGKKL